MYIILNNIYIGNDYFEDLNMSSVDKLLDITSRLEHIETSAEWIARETVHNDSSVSQTGTLICVLADDLREKIFALVKELEEIKELGGMN
jgi:hypothetical protein